MVPTYTVEQATLSVEKFVTQSLLAQDTLRFLNPAQLQTKLEFSVEQAAYSLTTIMKVPGTKLRPRILATYPATLWDHLKKSLGLRHESINVLSDHIVVFPELPIPKAQLERARVVVQYRKTRSDDAAD